jgi:hypothetical protein
MVLAAVVLFGMRLRSQLQIAERAAGYQHALQERALATRRGMQSVPTEEELQASAQELAQELGVTVTEIRAEVLENASPIGVGGMVAGQIGELQGPSEVDADGNVSRSAGRSVRTTLAKLQAHVHVEGFLCSLDRDVSAARNFGYALR